MANSDAEELLGKLAKEKKLRLSSNAEDRLKGSFIWRRATTLSGASLSKAQVEDRVRKEFDQVSSYLEGPLGANRRTGFLVPLRGGGNSDPAAADAPFLSLADLVRQRTSDPENINDVNSVVAHTLLNAAHEATSTRVRAVLAIVWRAAVLEESALWDATQPTLPQLRKDVLDEIVARRLRVVERMALNVGSREEMLSGDELSPLPREKWGFGTDSDKNWIDGLRVRLFEYPFTHPQAPIPGSQLNTVWTPEQFTDETGTLVTTRLGYSVLQSTTRTYKSDNATEKLEASAVWRFGTGEALFWVVAPGNAYGIDIAPDEPQAAAEVMDDLFDHTSTVDNLPIRADFWNRAWLFCDHVCSALNIEALLFGRRRRRGKLTADQEFASIASRILSVSVLREKSNGTEAVDKVDSSFVSLGAHVGDSSELDDGLLMSSDSNAKNDPYFTNIQVVPEDLQVGDQVKVRNARIFHLISTGGEWGLENAIVMDVDPSVDDKKNRGGLKLSKLTLQGHGTTLRNYDNYRQFMGDVLQPNFEKLIRSVLEAKLRDPTLVVLVLGAKSSAGTIDPSRDHVVVQWSPYPDLTQIELESPVRDRQGHPVLNVTSGPWWLIMPLTAADQAGEIQTVDDLLGAVPRALGRPVTNNKLAGVQDMTSTSSFKPGADFWDRNIVFPLFEPALAASKSDGLPKDQQSPWNVYFERKAANRRVAPTTLRPLRMDGQVVPGLLRRGKGDKVSIVKIRVDPKPTNP